MSIARQIIYCRRWEKAGKYQCLYRRSSLCRSPAPMESGLVVLLSGSAPHSSPSFKDALQNRSNNQPKGTTRSPPKGPGHWRKTTDSPKELSCLKLAKDIPIVMFSKDIIKDEIAWLESNVLICRFMGPRITPKNIVAWAFHSWSSTGDYSLSFFPSGYFMVQFACGFNGNTGQFMKPWQTGFIPTVEMPTSVPVWVQLHSPPSEYWKEIALEHIGNALGSYIGASEKTLEHKMFSYARVCVYMDLSSPLSAHISLQLDDLECTAPSGWSEALVDYENLPFRCRQCQEYGHLIRECPQNHTPTTEDNVGKAFKNPSRPPVATESALKSTQIADPISSLNQRQHSKPANSHSHSLANTNRFQLLLNLPESYVLEPDPISVPPSEIIPLIPWSPPAINAAQSLTPPNQEKIGLPLPTTDIEISLEKNFVQPTRNGLLILGTIQNQLSKNHPVNHSLASLNMPTLKGLKGKRVGKPIKKNSKSQLWKGSRMSHKVWLRIFCLPIKLLTNEDYHLEC